MDLERKARLSVSGLSIVCGTLNRKDQLIRLVESVERETTIPYILYVTDAGSDDGTTDYLRSVESDRVRPILVGEKLGQAKAYNDVFKQVDTPWVCWVSDDNEIVNHGLDQAVHVLQSDRRIGMVGLKVKDQEGPFVKAPYIGGISTIGILNVNQGVLPTPLLQKLGGFSEEFRDYGIDPDLTAKVLFEGYDVVYTKDVAIHHFRNWSMDTESEAYKSLKAKHDKALQLYEETYGSRAVGGNLSLKKKLYDNLKKLLQNRTNFSLNADQEVFGALPRDYYNAFHARYISMFDSLLHRKKSFHLRQSAPRGKGPKAQP